MAVRQQSNSAWDQWDDAVDEQARDEAEHWKQGSLRGYVACVCRSKIVEAIVIFLIFTDIGLLCIESSIDHHVLCINGDVVAKPTNKVALNIHENSQGLRQLQHDFGVRPGSLRRGGPNQNIMPDVYYGLFSAIQTSLTVDPHDTHSNEVLLCETRNGPRAYQIRHRCHGASIVILLLFLVEIGMKCWLDPPRFFSNRFLVIDAAVVIVSIIVDTAVTWIVRSHSPDNAGSVALIVAALLFIRMWRIVRIFHGLAGYLHEVREKQEEERKEHELLRHSFRHSLSDIKEFHTLCEDNNVVVPEHLKHHTERERHASAFDRPLERPYTVR